MDPLLDALQAELARNSAALRLDDYPNPYFVAYQLLDEEQFELGAKRGALYSDKRGRQRNLYVEVRVGDYALDNSEDQDHDMQGLDHYVPNELAPLDDSAEALRHALWLLTDFRYKQALAAYHNVRGKRVFAPESGGPAAGSFTREEAVAAIEPLEPLDFPDDEWRARLRRLSQLATEDPLVFDAYLEIKARRVVRRFVNLEGSRIRTVARYYSVSFQAMTRAPDGMLLEHGTESYCRDPGHLPSEAQLTADIRLVLSQLAALRAAPVLDPYTGPAILEPEATGVFFHEAVGHRLEAYRTDADEEGQTFKGRLGQVVMPTFLSILDDPTRLSEGEKQLNGFYRYDEDGVAARPVTLVENGVLRTFLLGRRPFDTLTRSNGHGRSDGESAPSARMGNFIVRGAAPLSHPDLTKRLIDEARRQGRPFGLRIGSIIGGSTNTSSYGYQAFKGTPRMVYKVDARTGQETLVRGVEMVGTPLSSIGKIVATSDRYGVFNGYCGADSGWVPVSAVAPEALFREIEVQRTVRREEKPQILPPPPSDDATPTHSAVRGASGLPRGEGAPVTRPADAFRPFARNLSGKD